MKWFNQLKVRNRFLVIGLFILPFLLGLAGVGVGGVFQVNALRNKVEEQQLPSVYELGQALALVQQVRISYRDALIETDPVKLPQLIATTREIFNKTLQNWEQYKKL